MSQNFQDVLMAQIHRAGDRVYAVNPPTRLEEIHLPALAGSIHLKREDLSAVRSYKWRGAFNLMSQLSEEGRSNPVVTASAGNHAQGVALAARLLGLRASIYMPETTPEVKKQAVRRHGGEAVSIILTGDTYDQAAAAAKRMAVERHQVYIPAFDNIHTIAGQGTMGTEIVNSGAGPFDLAFLQIGGGGMAAGVSTVLRRAYPGIRIIGVEGENQASMRASFRAGAPVTLSHVDSFCDGTAVTRPGDLCFRFCRENLQGILTVSNADIHAAMEAMWNATRAIPEPSGAMGLAGLMRYARENPQAIEGRKVITVISGANMDFHKLGAVFGGNAASTQNRKHLRFEIGEQRGSLLDLVETHFSDVNISAFQYGKVDPDKAWPVIAFDADDKRLAHITARLDNAGVPFQDVTLQDDASNRIVPYNPYLFRNPLLLHVAFPERQGALREFLRVAQPEAANLCYFNYTYGGDMVGNAVIGFEFDSPSMHQTFMDKVAEASASCRPVETGVSKRMLFNQPQGLKSLGF